MEHPTQILISPPELFTALSYALDITEGQPRGHSVRCCWIGIHIGQRLSLSKEQAWELYYTLLLKDAGCSSNAARLFQLYGSDDLKTKHDFKQVNSHKLLQVLSFIIQNTTLSKGRLAQIKRIVNFVRNGKQLTTELIQTRCERGANITRRLGFNEAVANGVRHLDEHYNGGGRPDGLKGKEIPLYSRIALLSQVADVFYQIGGPLEAQKEIKFRSGSWFDPVIVQAFLEAATDASFWDVLNNNSTEQALLSLEPSLGKLRIDEGYLDTVALAFADIIDAKSPFTFGHSTRVAAYADILAEKMGMEANRRRWFHRGALLHDIGKLGVSNAILDKPGKLTEEEFTQIKLHPKYTEEILSKISIFKELASMAGAHHERLDGKGYHKGLTAKDICLETRILTLADVFDALSAKRPYREAMPLEKVFGILEEMRGSAIDSDCLNEFKSVLDKVVLKMKP
jgi:putative nucleotidyltransferase with HDIG domain